MAVPAVVSEVSHDYLDLVDDALPGLVEGLYITGSGVLGDFQPGRSDIDFVAVSSVPATAEQAAALQLVHTALAQRHRRPYFDGPYVTWSQLAAPPSIAEPGPQAHEGRVQPKGSSDRHPVLWLTLARYGAAIRGPNRKDVSVHIDLGELATWAAGNLDSYWRPWRARCSRLLSPAGLAALGSWAPEWGVLGVSRLHYTLATGDITSKRGAGEYARDAFDPRWHRVIDECLRIRSGVGGRSLYRTPFTRRSEALAFMGFVMDDALRFGPA